MKQIEPSWVADPRGTLTEIVSGLEDDYGPFVTCEVSHNKFGALRGLHYQEVYPQGKLIYCAKGYAFDVAVNLKTKERKETYIGPSGPMVWIEPGWAHGFLALANDTIIIYHRTAHYHAEDAKELRWNDPDIGIQWPLHLLAGGEPIISPKDMNAPLWRELNREGA